MASSFSFGAAPGATTATTKAVTFNMANTPTAAATTQSLFTLPNLSGSTPFGSAGFKPAAGTGAGATPAFGLGAGGSGTLSSTFATSTGGSTVAAAGPTLGTATSFGFPTAASTSTSGLFGAVQPQPSAAAGFSFGGGGAPAATTTAGAPSSAGFGLFAAQPTSAASSAAPSFGLPTVSSSSGGIGFGSTYTSCFPATSAVGPTPVLTLGGLGAPSVAAKSVPSGSTAQSGSEPLGLGGVSATAVSTTAASSAAAARLGNPSDLKGVKDSAMPPELVQTVENFKKHVKEERAEREAIVTSSSCDSSSKVQEQMAGLRHLVLSISRDVQRNSVSIAKLKADTGQELHNVETAVQTKEIPSGLQYENEAPTEYFRHIVCGFERDAQVYRQLVEDAESHLARASDGREKPLSAQDLLSCLKKTHDTFVLLAAQLHTIHERVKSQKAQYLNYRKVILNDETDLFEKVRSAGVRSRGVGASAPGYLVGPTPFDAGMSSHASAAMTAALASSQPGYVTSSTAIFGGGISLPTPFKDTARDQHVSAVTSEAQQALIQPAFALQNPPLGSKRGKRA